MSQRYRILHLRASPFVGGPERQILRYAEYENAGPLELILGTFFGHGEGEEFLAAARSRGIMTLALPEGATQVVPALVSLLRFLAEQQVALVCTHGYKADVLGTLACRIRGIPVAWFLRGWTAEDSKVRLYEALDRALLPMATRVVCLSEARARQLSDGPGLAQKVRVIPNAIDPPELTERDRVESRRRLRDRFGLAEDTPVVVTAGRFSPEKGMIYLLRAIPEILQKCPKAHFVMFGDGGLREQLEVQAKEFGLETVVHFPGFVAEFPKLLPGVDVLVNPSLSEEMPNVVLEGMAAAIPVVATAVGGVAELAGSDDGVVLLPPANPTALAQAVADLLRNSSRARELARAARQRVEQAFSAAQQKVRLRGLYQELVPAALPKIQPAVQAEPPFLSVVIPVRNEESNLGAVLDDLFAQEYPKNRYEILVAEGISSDGTAALIERYAHQSPVRLVRLNNPKELPSAGRNLGVQKSQGEIVIFIDGHCRVPSQTLLRDTAQLFEITGADCLCRPQPLTAAGSSRFQQLVAQARASWLGHGRGSTIYQVDGEGFINPTSSGASYRRSVFDCVGWYDENFDACEDAEFNYRVFRSGLRSYTSPRLTVQYQPRASLRALWRQMMRYGRGRWRLVRKHREAWSVPQLLPAALLLWLLVGGPASLVSTRVAHVALSPLLAYGALVLFFSVRLALQHSWRYLLMAPAVYLTIHLGLGAGFLAEAVGTLRVWLALQRGVSRVGGPHAAALDSPAKPAEGMKPLS